MAVKVPTTKYSTVDIYEQVTGSAIGSRKNISLTSLFTDTSCSLQSQYKTGSLNSRVFSDYIGNKSRNIQMVEEILLGWVYNGYCTLWEDCPYDISTGIKFELSEANWDCSIKSWPAWITIWDQLGGTYVTNQLINKGSYVSVVPNSQNGTTARDGSIVIGTNVGNIFQVSASDLTIYTSQSASPVLPIGEVSIDPSDYGDISIGPTLTTVQLSIGSTNVNLIDLQIDDSYVSEFTAIDVSWRAERTTPSATNRGYGNLNVENKQTQEKSITLSQTAQADEVYEILFKKTPIITRTPTSHNFSKSGGDVSIYVTTTAKNPWLATDSCTWITLYDDSKSDNTIIGSGQFKIEVSSQVSGGGPIRSGRVFINSQGLQTFVDITQDASIAIDPPTGLSLTQADGSVAGTWTPVTGATNYDYRLNVDSEGYGSATSTGTSTSFSTSPLTWPELTSVCAQVRVTTSAGTSDWSIEDCIIIGDEPA